MNRFLGYALGPELVMLAVTLWVYAYCARHGSGEGRDLRLLEQLVIFLPPLATGAAFLTLLVPGAQNWTWLMRAILASTVGTAVLTLRLVEGLGPGAKGQDAALIIAVITVGATLSIGSSCAGAMILAGQNSGFAEWFRMRPLVGVALTVLAALPIGIALGATVLLVGGLVAGFWSAIRS